MDVMKKLEVLKGHMKGNIEMMLKVGTLLGVTVLVIAIMSIVLTSFQGQTTAGSYAYNVTNAGLVGLFNMANFSGTIGTVAGGVAVLALVLGVLYFLGVGAGRK